MTVSFAAFATLGDGSKKGPNQRGLLTAVSGTNTTPINYKNFTLKSRYNFRGNNILSLPATTGKYIVLNTTVTYQKGKDTYIVPMKRKVLLENVKLSWNSNFKP
ncbi:MAG TPA: hypothetical protein VHK69_12145 [Chitinophagaceae bacterium]|nr:hypothetical protein [Chitinophagaceae bacterium]